ncbi:MAG: choice-of-anchor D domain-containing protein [Candidatus Kapaibacterium sp.]
MLSAQTLIVGDTRSDEYPLIRTEFFLVDSDLEIVRNIAADDITITESGLQRDIVSLDCSGHSRLTKISSVLAIDISSSMDGSRLNAAKSAARNWIDRIPLDSSECAVVSFNEFAYLNSDFSQNPAALKAAVDALEAGGGTSYESAFLNPYAGALTIAEKGRKKRIVVFLTDGVANSEANRIIQTANSINATVYCVVAGMPAPLDVKRIALETGGLYFEDISESGLGDAFRRILLDALDAGPCIAEWLTSGCETMRDGNLRINPVNISANFNYDIQSADFPNIRISPSADLNFGVVAEGKQVSGHVQITAKNGNIRVHSIILDHPDFEIVDYGGEPPTFVLLEDSSRLLTIVYTAPDTLYTYANLIINSTACGPAKVNLTAGSKYAPAKDTTLRIIKPNGGEILAAGSKLDIEWDGVAIADDVSLEFSTNAGTSWLPVAARADGLSYEWRIPEIASDRCLMRISQISAENYYNRISQLVGHAGPTEDVKFHPNGKTLASGSHDGSIRIWDCENNSEIELINTERITVSSIEWNAAGSRIASANGLPDVLIWNSSNGSLLITLKADAIIRKISWSNSSNLIAGAGSDGKIYIWNPGIPEPIEVIDAHNGAVASIEYSPDGMYLASGGEDGILKIWKASDWSEYRKYQPPMAGKISTLSWSQSENDWRVAFAHTSGDVAVLEVTSQFIVKRFKESDRNVSAIEWSPDASIIAIGGDDNAIRLWYTDSESLYYEFTGHIDRVLSIDWTAHGNMIASGSYETRILKWTPDDIPFEGHAIQSDNSDALWSIAVPSIDVRDVEFGTVATGDMLDTLIPNYFFNNGSLPVSIDSVLIDGGDFAYLSPPLPMTIDPGETMFAEMRFSPSEHGNKQSLINIFTQNKLITRNISGSAIAPGLGIDSKIIDFGDILIGRSADSTFENVRNISGQLVDNIRASQTGPEFTAFDIYNGTGDFALDPDESRTFSVRFDAAGHGAKMGGILIEYDGPGSPGRIDLYANVVAPEALAPASASFSPIVCPDETSAARLFIRNIGDGNMHLNSATITGADASQFRIRKFNPDTLRPTESVELFIDFLPDSPGIKNAEFRINTNMQKNGHAAIVYPLSARKDSAGFRLSAGILSFAGLDPQTTYSKTFSIENTGTIPLEWDYPVSKNKFKINEIIPGVTPPGANSRVELEFSGGNEGEFFEEHYKFGGICGDSAEITFTASVGRDDALISAVSRINFPTLTCEKYIDTSFTIENVGAASLTITDLSFEDSQNGNFSISATFTDWVIAPGNKRQIYIRFMPHETGDISENLIIRSNASNSTDGKYSIQLNGRKNDYGIIFIPDSLHFEVIPEQTSRRQEVTIVNTGTLPYKIPAAMDSGKFRMESGFGQIVPVGESATITMLFKGGNARESFNAAFALADSCGEVSLLPVSAYVIGPSFVTIAAQSVIAAPGDTVSIPIMITDHRDLYSSGVTAIEFEIEYNASLLMPIGTTPTGRIERLRRIIPISASVPAEGDNMLANAEFLVVVGDTTFTEIAINSALTIGDIIAVNTVSGTFTSLSDMSIRHTRKTELHCSEPHPASGMTMIRYETAESGETELALYDIFGRKRAVLDRGHRESGEYEIWFNAGEFPMGTYFLMLRTPSDWRMKKMIILR